ncbi:MAG TPA: hypothetical protein VF717_07700 [Pyrinomonadaceae bacterium]|jgi:hypothetical protein
MKRAFFVIPALILFSLVLGMSEARACEPCTKEASLKFEETARRADLIIIGQRYDFRPDELTHGTFGPENIRVQVRRVFKGEEGRDEITVKSWSGMCPYGIILNDNQPHVIFLKKSGDTYRAVDMCSIKDYLIKDDMVEFGRQKITVEDFRLKLEKVR